MPSQSAIQKMNKLLDNRKFRMKDSDKDGVPDMLDCQPHNPKKQGIIHDIKQKVRDIKQKKKEEGVERGVREEKAHQAAREEREKQAVKTAKYKEELRGEKARAYAKSGGFLGSVGRFVDKASAPPRRAPARRRKVAPLITKKKRKKLKRKVKKMTRRKVKKRIETRAPQFFDVSKFKY